MIAGGAKVGLDALIEKMKEGESQELKLVVKADVQGSSEALVKALAELATEKVKVTIIHSGVGGITESDVMLASRQHGDRHRLPRAAVGRRYQARQGRARRDPRLHASSTRPSTR